MFQGNQKSQFYFIRDYCCEVTVKNVRKSIFSMFWAINQYPLELVKFQCNNKFPEMLPIRNISYLLPMCCSFWEKCKNSPKTDLGCSTPLSTSIAQNVKTVRLCTEFNKNKGKHKQHFSDISHIVTFSRWQPSRWEFHMGQKSVEKCSDFSENSVKLLMPCLHSLPNLTLLTDTAH